jgi:hypothetical protein
MVKAFDALFDKIVSWQPGDSVILVYDEDFFIHS